MGRAKRNYKREPEQRWGLDFITEVRSRSNLEPKVIFDVGAHIGVTALLYSDCFPNATIYAFEPGSDNMRQLRENLVGAPDVRKHQIAFGVAAGTGALLTEPEHPSMARFGNGAGPTENVPIDTVDQFCTEHDVDRIDLMKIDTEGFELEVLEGAKSMLEQKRIGMIKAECAIDPDNDYHIELRELCDFLMPYGYRLFGIFDQYEDPFNSTSLIRRFDVALLHVELNSPTSLPE